jgi:hypothetical protein
MWQSDLADKHVNSKSQGEQNALTAFRRREKRSAILNKCY